MATLASWLATRRTRAVAAGAVAALVVAAIGVAVAARGSDRPVPDGPNVVVIMTDDQTLASMAVMDGTRALLGEQGTTFTHAVVSFPSCCPSRATYLTGRYAHGHGVVENRAPWGGAGRLDEDETLPVWLHDAGYDTVHVGKYLNEWGVDGDIDPPAGWDRWFSLIDPTTYRYRGFSVSVDGERRDYGEAPADYSTDVLAAEAVAQIEQRAGGGRPFFLSFTPLAPHAATAERAPDEPGTASGGGGSGFGLPEAPDRYATTYSDAPVPRDASWDEQDVSDKPESVQRPPLSDNSVDYIARYETAELGSLAAVDDAVEAIVGALDAEGELDDTVILFTSDNGLFHGEHRIVTGKFLLYEPAIRVPLLVRGPGVPAGVEVSTPVANVDLAPTVLDVAGVDPGVRVDGHSLLDVATADDLDVDRAIALENYLEDDLVTSGVRTRRWTYLEHTDGARELYDLQADPAQLENRAGDDALAEVQADLAEVAEALRTCVGAACDPSLPASVSTP